MSLEIWVWSVETCDGGSGAGTGAKAGTGIIGAETGTIEGGGLEEGTGTGAGGMDTSRRESKGSGSLLGRLERWFWRNFERNFGWFDIFNSIFE